VFGHGRETCYMGTWSNGKPVTPCMTTSAPAPDKPQDFYAFAWDFGLNPLIKMIFFNK
jgi:hypothetical protein